MKISFEQSTRPDSEKYIRVPFQGRIYEIQLPVKQTENGQVIQRSALLDIAYLLRPAILMSNSLRFDVFKTAKPSSLARRSPILQDFIDEHGSVRLHEFYRETSALRNHMENADTGYVLASSVKNLPYALEALAYLKQESGNFATKHKQDAAYWARALAGKVVFWQEKITPAALSRRSWLDRLFA